MGGGRNVKPMMIHPDCIRVILKLRRSRSTMAYELHSDHSASGNKVSSQTKYSPGSRQRIPGSTNAFESEVNESFSVAIGSILALGLLGLGQYSKSARF